MDRRDWYIGAVLVAAAVLVPGMFPRYEWHTDDRRMLRIDRWTGHTELGSVSPAYGRWASLQEIERDSKAYRTALAAEAARRSSGAPGANQRAGADIHLSPDVCPPLPKVTDKGALAEVDRLLYTECNVAKQRK